MGIWILGFTITKRKFKVGNDVQDKSAEIKKASKIVELLKRMLKEQPLGTAGAIITLVMVLIAIFAPFIAPYKVNQMTGFPLLRPSLKFLMGTDNLGRDIFSRVIYGARISVTVGLLATLMSVIISTIIGVLSGYIGGAFDLILQRFVDAFMCLPGLVILMLLVSLAGAGLWQIIIILGVTGGIGGSRMMRGIVFSMKENTYLQAAIAIGASTPTIFRKHILPNILAPLIIIFSLSVPGTVLAEAGLSFLGFGVPPPTPTWGGMLSGDARIYMFQAPWMAFFPGLALSILVYGVNMFGDALRDILDPRLRGGVGRYGIKVKKLESRVSPVTKE
jgi:peptide/nickel transport system permease protein